MRQYASFYSTLRFIECAEIKGVSAYCQPWYHCNFQNDYCLQISKFRNIVVWKEREKKTGGIDSD